MASYPALGQGLDTRVSPVSGHELDFSVEGFPRGRRFHAASTFEITIVHPVVDATDRTTIIDFYEANKSLSVTVTSLADGVSTDYDCIWMGRPTADPISGTQFRVTSRLVGQVA